MCARLHGSQHLARKRVLGAFALFVCFSCFRPLGVADLTSASFKEWTNNYGLLHLYELLFGLHVEFAAKCILSVNCHVYIQGLWWGKCP